MHQGGTPQAVLAQRWLDTQCHLQAGAGGRAGAAGAAGAGVPGRQRGRHLPLGQAAAWCVPGFVNNDLVTTHLRQVLHVSIPDQHHEQCCKNENKRLASGQCLLLSAGGPFLRLHRVTGFVTLSFALCLHHKRSYTLTDFDRVGEIESCARCQDARTTRRWPPGWCARTACALSRAQRVARAATCALPSPTCCRPSAAPPPRGCGAAWSSWWQRGRP